jgi:hypothetical protein
VHELENLSFVLALEKSATAKEVVAAVAESVAVEDGVLGPCNAEPIRVKHLEDSHHPFQQIPLGSYMAESPQSTTFSTYPVRFSSVQVEVIPV